MKKILIISGDLRVLTLNLYFKIWKKISNNLEKKFI